MRRPNAIKIAVVEHKSVHAQTLDSLAHPRIIANY